MKEEHQAILDQFKRPLNKRLIIVRDQGEESWGGLHLPEESRRKLNSGTLIAMAQDCEVPVEVGDHVAFMSFAGTEMNIGALGSQHAVVVMRENDLVMVLADDVFSQQGEKVLN